MINILKNIYFPFEGKEVKGSLIFTDKIKTFIHGDDIEISVEGNTIDGEEKLLLPGFIDSHVHFNTPGFTHRETFEKGTRGAIKGGVTTIMDMPCTSLPPVVGKDEFENKYNVVKNDAWCDYAFHGGISANLFDKKDFEIFTTVSELASKGVTALKVYTLSGMETFKHLDNFQLMKTMRAAAHKGLTVMIHAEDASIITHLQNKYISEDKNKPLHYYNSRPEEAELVAINNVAYFSTLTGAKIHIVHISTYEGVKLVQNWRERGANITCETCPQYLEFNFNDLIEQGSILKTAPVIKTPEDSKNLWLELASGDIHFVTTDHAPCVFEKDKNTGSIWTDYGGIPGVEIIYPFLISEGYFKKKLTLERLIEISCLNQSNLFGINRQKNGLRPGSDADFVLVDKNTEYKVDASNFESIGKYSPFSGKTFKGKIENVFLRGEEVVKKGEIISKKGILIKR